MNPVKRVAFACAAAGLLAVAVPGTAYAAPGNTVRFTPNDSTSPCRFYAVNDTSENGQLGGPYTFHGVVTLDFVAPVSQGQMLAATVSCELVVNFDPGITVLGPDTGGVIVDAKQLQFTASPGDFIEMCTHVQIGTGTPTVTCEETAEFRVNEGADNVICGVLVSAAPVVDALNEPSIVWIDPNSGDLFVVGDLIYDCFPYINPN